MIIFYLIPQTAVTELEAIPAQIKNAVRALLYNGRPPLSGDSGHTTSARRG